MLTKKQKELLGFLSARAALGNTPSFEEMKDAVGLKSKSGIHRLILALEERGYIKRLPNRARAIDILRPLVEAAKTAVANAVQVPVYGYIAAGTPIEAINHVQQTMEIPASMLGNGQYYGLVVKGDSMIDAGIMDGDIAVIEKTDVAQTGQIVVALVKNEEATLKYFRKKGDNVLLEPANVDYQTQTWHASDVKVQGKLKTILRNY